MSTRIDTLAVKEVMCKTMLLHENMDLTVTNTLSSIAIYSNNPAHVKNLIKSDKVLSLNQMHTLVYVDKLSTSFSLLSLVCEKANRSTTKNEFIFYVRLWYGALEEFLALFRNMLFAIRFEGIGRDGCSEQFMSQYRKLRSPKIYDLEGSIRLYKSILDMSVFNFLKEKSE